MRCLDLFSGTGSVSRALPDAEVVTVDNCKKFNPTHLCDVLKFDYKQYPVGYFDVIWASPPCTAFSVAKTHGERNLQLADSLAEKALEIIEYLQAPKWFIENPAYGMLRDRPYMQSIHSHIVTYCMYGYLHMKPTRLWTNVNNFMPKKCCKDNRCPGFLQDHNCHAVQLRCAPGNVKCKEKQKRLISEGIVTCLKSPIERAKVPEQLIRDLVHL